MCFKRTCVQDRKMLFSSVSCMWKPRKKGIDYSFKGKRMWIGMSPIVESFFCVGIDLRKNNRKSRMNTKLRLTYIQTYFFLLGCIIQRFGNEVKTNIFCPQPGSRIQLIFQFRCSHMDFYWSWNVLNGITQQFDKTGCRERKKTCSLE